MPGPTVLDGKRRAHRATRAGLGVAALLAVVVVATAVVTAWRIANVTGSDADRLATQAQLVIGALQFVVAVVLAAVTAWYVVVTRGILLANQELLQESVRARQDARSASLSILLPSPDVPGWFLAPQWVGAPATPLQREFVLPAEAAMRVMVRVEALLTNEGSSSVVLTLHGCDFKFARGTGAFDQTVLGHGDAPMPQLLADSRWVIRPGQHALLLLEPACAVEEWLANAEGQTSTLVIEASAQNNPRVVDRWELVVRARPLELDTQDRGRARPTFRRQPLVVNDVLHVGVVGPERDYLA